MKEIKQILDGSSCPMCGSKDIEHKVHATPPSRDMFHCRSCKYEWYHFY
jgi:hypothetical protein